MTKAEIRAATRARLQRESTLGVRVTDTEIDHFTDDGYQDLAERTGAIVRTVTLSAGPAEHFVPLPADCIFPHLLRDLGANEPIDFVDWTFIDHEDTTWIRRTATFPSVAALWGLSELLIHPAYSSAGSIELIYAAQPVPLTDGQEPEFPSQHHQALIHYNHYRALLKDAHGDIAGRRLGAAKRQKSTYLLMAGTVERWGMDRHGVMRVRTYGEVLRRHDLENFPSVGSDYP